MRNIPKLLPLFVLIALVAAGCGDDDGSSCQDECTAGAGRCTGDMVERCGADTHGCLVWQTETDCATAGQTCDATGSDATCSGTCAGDADCDGVPTASDCDDNDPNVGSNTEDADCDGVPTADDCDDNDPNLGAVADDADCDGVLTANDCDDNDPNVGSNTEDADCDGVLTADDCDDNDPNVGSSADDADCDGVPTAQDCDDSDPNLGAVVDDADCDGVLIADDCDDNNPNLGDIAGDADCDGVLTADDCDDNDPNLGDIGNDADCDGVLIADDCDDNDPNLGDIGNDADCDGFLTVLDCDDGDSAVTADATDADCDGASDIVIFRKDDFADPTDPANQDCITSNVCVTRGDNSGIYNAVSESSYVSNTSPADVEFAQGYVGQTLSYTPWGSAIRNGSWWPFQPMAMHLITDGLDYNVLDFHWTTRSQGGGFGWARAGVKTFQKVDMADPTAPANQDCLVPGVCLTRGNTQSLYNAAIETQYVNGVSPAGTEWAPLPTRDATPGAYTVFADATGGSPQSMIGQVMSVHITGTNVYYDVVITSWSGGGPGGGFAWARSRALVVGCADSAAANYDPRATVEDGFCGDWVRVEIPSDPDASDPANHDCITPTICLTRGISTGLYNPAQETAFTPNDSPLGTLWAPSATADATTTDYTTWVDMVDWSPPSYTNQRVSLWIPSAGRFFDVVVVRWPGDGSGGGVTYLRHEVLVSSTCGNGVLELGEECDDGNNTDGDGCQGNCLLPVCGDGILDASQGEVCDEGSANSEEPDATCRTNCQPAGCGDGVLDSGEGCDDGNLVNGDGCEDTCDLGCAQGTDALRGAPRASDGACLLLYGTYVPWNRAEVQCESVGGHLVTVTDAADNALVQTFAQSVGGGPWIGYTDQSVEGSFGWVSGSTSTYTHWSTGEPNDSGGNEDCTMLYNGNGLWNDETCGASRPFVCETLCGNGVLNTGEACDDGAANSDAPGSNCRNNCQTAPACGDGILDPGEECDDGNTTDADGCEGDCTLACGAGLGAVVAAVLSPTDGACFLRYDESLTWDSAEAACVALGGHLATVSDAAENDALATLRDGALDNFWIGFNDVASEGTFEWVSGDPATFTHWNTGEPNNFGGEDCGEMVPGGQWNDYRCDGLRTYVCETP